MLRVRDELCSRIDLHPIDPICKDLTWVNFVRPQLANFIIHVASKLKGAMDAARPDILMPHVLKTRVPEKQK